MSTAPTAADLTPEKALIWRVVHRDNIPWILDHGLYCANGAVLDPNYVEIGLSDLIRDRSQHPVKVPPHGTLADYVPFYFTPFSPMVYRILTGRGVTQRGRPELCFIVSSLPHLESSNIGFICADRHASLATAQFLTGADALNGLPWQAWQSRDFERDPSRPEDFERYQAEVLVHRHVPLAGIQGIVCYDRLIHDSVIGLAAGRAPNLKVVVRPGWYL